MRIRALSVIAAVCAVVAAAFAGEDSNPPWFPSLQAFEHYDSARSHVFSQAEFRGSFHRPNTVAEVRSAEGAYPSGYNMSYLNENEAFIQGGSYGNLPGSIGPFVAKVAMASPGARNITGFNERVSTAAARGKPLGRRVQIGFDPDTGEELFEEEQLDYQTLPQIVLIVDAANANRR